jgi:catalase
MSHSATLGALWQRAALAARRMAGARINGAPADLSGRHVAVLAADGVDLEQLDAVKVALRLAGAKVTVLAHRKGRLQARDGRRNVAARHTLRGRPPVMFDALYVPGGEDSVCALCDDDEALRFVREAFRYGKAIAASGDGVQVLRMAGLPVADDPRQGVVPGLVTDGVVNGLGELGDAFVGAIAQGRHWRRATPRALLRATQRPAHSQ